MFPRVGGAVLALAAAALLAVAVVATPWWDGHPDVDGRPMHLKSLDVGPLGANSCNTGGDGKCSSTSIESGFKITGIAVAGSSGLLAVVLVLLAFQTLRRSDSRRGLGKVAIAVMVIATASGITLLVLGPGILAPNHTLTVPRSSGFLIFFAGTATAVAAALVTAREIPRALFIPTASAANAQLAAQGPFDVRALLGDDHQQQRPSQAHMAVDHARSPGGSLAGPSGPLGVQGPLFASAPQLRPLYEMEGHALAPMITPIIPDRAPTPMPREEIDRMDAEGAPLLGPKRSLPAPRSKPASIAPPPFTRPAAVPPPPKQFKPDDVRGPLSVGAFTPFDANQASSPFSASMASNSGAEARAQEAVNVADFDADFDAPNAAPAKPPTKPAIPAQPGPSTKPAMPAQPGPSTKPAIPAQAGPSVKPPVKPAVPRPAKPSVPPPAKPTPTPFDISSPAGPPATSAPFGVLPPPAKPKGFMLPMRGGTEDPDGLMKTRERVGGSEAAELAKRENRESEESDDHTSPNVNIGTSEEDALMHDEMSSPHRTGDVEGDHPANDPSEVANRERLAMRGIGMSGLDTTANPVIPTMDAPVSDVTEDAPPARMASETGGSIGTAPTQLAATAVAAAPAAVEAPKIPISTASEQLPPPTKKQSQTSGPSPACPQCEAPMAWVEEHLRFYCKSCRMYF